MSISTQDQASRTDESAATGETETPDEGGAESTAQEQPTEPTPSLDVVFDILRNRRRRLVLNALEEWEGSTTLSELAEHIGGIENDKSPDALNAQERKRVYVGLYQCHLPKMDDAGAIEFDKDRGTVEHGEWTEKYHTYLHREVERELPWPKYYSATAAAAAAVCLGSIVSGGPTVLLSVGSIALLGVVSAYHWVES